VVELNPGISGRSQPGVRGPNAGMKDWRTGGIGMVSVLVVDKSSTNERRVFWSGDVFEMFQVQSFLCEMLNIEGFGVKFQA